MMTEKSRRWVLLILSGALFFLMAVDRFAPEDVPLSVRLSDRLLVPFSRGGWYALGADEQGRAVFFQVLQGMFVSLKISGCAVVMSLCLGLPYGIFAGWLGGKWETSFLFLADSFQAFPGMLLAIALAAVLPGSAVNLVLILGIVGWVGFARLARAQVLALRECDFLLATRAIGLPLWRVIGFHLLPNMSRALVVQASFALAGVILAEATLSFLGLGLPPSVPSLGKMMDSGVRYLLLAPHLAIIPGLAIFVLVLVFNLLGDAVADRSDRVG